MESRGAKHEPSGCRVDGARQYQVALRRGGAGGRRVGDLLLSRGELPDPRAPCLGRGTGFPEGNARYALRTEDRPPGLKVADGVTFHWKGYYEYDLNIAH